MLMYPAFYSLFQFISDILKIRFRMNFGVKLYTQWIENQRDGFIFGLDMNSTGSIK